MSDAASPGHPVADAFPFRAGRLPAAFDRNLAYVLLAALVKKADRYHDDAPFEAADALYDAALSWGGLSRDPSETAAFAGALVRAALRLQRLRHGRRLALARKRRHAAPRGPAPQKRK